MIDNILYIVYKTINLINGKFYIGVHKEDGRKYFGSGKLLKQAIKKYGRENFIRETLREFSNEQDAYDYEKELVNEELINNPLCYNLVGGGCNPPTYYGEDHPSFGKHHSLESKRKISSSNKGYKHSLIAKELIKTNNSKYWLGKKRSKETINKIREGNTGRKLSDIIKSKISSSNKGKHNNKLWVIRGNIFESSSKAAIFYNVSRKTISNWCSTDSKFKKDNCYSVKGDV